MKNNFTAQASKEGEYTAFDVRVNHACYYLCPAESGHCSVYSLPFLFKMNKGISYFACLFLPCRSGKSLIESPHKPQEPMSLSVAASCPAVIFFLESSSAIFHDIKQKNPQTVWTCKLTAEEILQDLGDQCA